MDSYILLKRYLMLGGTLQVSLSTLDISKVLDICKEYQHRVFKKDYIIDVLAFCCCDKTFRKSAYDLVASVCTIPTNLFMFISKYEEWHNKVHSSTGWNKAHKRFVKNWYLSKTPSNLAYLITKYKNRNEWTHKDVLKLAHINPCNQHTHEALFAYITKDFNAFSTKINQEDQVYEYIKGYEAVKRVSCDPETAIALIRKHKFAHEHVNSALLKNIEVWNALIEHIPPIALLRNLNRECNVDITQKILDIKGVHPLQILIAIKQYNTGRGFSNKDKTWTPKPEILDALNKAFKKAFDNVKTTNKRYLLALDVSSSMTCATVSGIRNMMASEVATAMAMVFVLKEPNCDIMGFAHEFKKLEISPDKSLQDNMQTVYDLTFGATDASLPFTWAMQNEKQYDVVIVITDSETNCHKEEPSVVLRRYREMFKLETKLVVIATSSNEVSIANPNDPNMLDIAGFDVDTPNVVAEFVKGF